MMSRILQAILTPSLRIAAAAWNNWLNKYYYEMIVAEAAAECLAARVAARQGSDTLKSLARSEAQLAAFDTYVLPSRKGSGRS